MAKREFIYGKMSETIRMMPENYLVAKKDVRRWVMDPDKALDANIACIVFRTIFESYDLTYTDGETLAQHLNNLLGF